jgi:hypothetical protein
MRRIRFDGMRPTLALLALSALLVAACGDDDEGGAEKPSGTAADRQLQEAASVRAADFPPAGGRTLEQVANTIESGPQLGLATSVFTRGRNRLAFGVIDSQQRFVLAKSAVYLARTPNSRALGPFPAPAYSMETAPRFRSRTVAEDRAAPKAIYAAQVPLKSAGRYSVVVASRVGGRLVGAITQLKVAADDPIPGPGERPPAIDTPTVSSVGGEIETIETRVPPDTMHEVSFADVVGRRPVALLFATPALCESRTCGPVVDEAEELKAEFGDRMAFVHQEIYVDNDPSKGYRSQLRAFGLQTEPWLFTFDREGRVAARLEGAFGLEEFRRAVEAALG